VVLAPIAARPPSKPTVAPIAPTKPTEPTVAPTKPTTAIDWTEAKANVGKTLTVCGPVAGTFYATGSNGQPTFIDLGFRNPDPKRFTVLIWGRNRVTFPFAPEQEYSGKQRLCAHGTVADFRGVPQIEAQAPASVTVR
jgi:hypothetical protein